MRELWSSTMSNAVIIKADGTKELTDNYELADLQKVVGGLIECVTLHKRLYVDMWVNEEGKLTGLPQNPIATALFVDEYGTRDVILGDVIITGGIDHEGETQPLNSEQEKWLMDYSDKVYLL